MLTCNAAECHVFCQKETLTRVFEWLTKDGRTTISKKVKRPFEKRGKTTSFKKDHFQANYLNVNLFKSLVSKKSKKKNLKKSYFKKYIYTYSIYSNDSGQVSKTAYYYYLFYFYFIFLVSFFNNFSRKEHTTLHIHYIHCTLHKLHYTILNCTTIHYTTLHYTKIHYTTPTTLHLRTLIYTTLQTKLLHERGYEVCFPPSYNPRKLPIGTKMKNWRDEWFFFVKTEWAIYYTALHNSTLQCTTLHNRLHYTNTTQLFRLLHYTKLIYTILHWTTQKYTRLHYATL